MISSPQTHIFGPDPVPPDVLAGQVGIWKGAPRDDPKFRGAWAARKRGSQRVSGHLVGADPAELDMIAAGGRMGQCLLTPIWGVLECACPDRTERRLIGAIRCGDRLCPSCAHIDREHWGRRLAQRLDPDPGTRLVFLTLTHLSCERLTGEEFSSILADFAKLRRTKLWRGVSASASSVEVTHTENGWHVHLHSLLEVERGAWLPGQAAWSKSWGRISGAPIMDIRPVRRGKAGLKEVMRELLKYVTKPVSLHGPDEGDLTRELWRAMRGRHLLSTTGRWRGAFDTTEEPEDAAREELQKAGLVPCPKCGHRPALSLQGWVWAGTHYYRMTPDDTALRGSRRMLLRAPPPGYIRSSPLELEHVRRGMAAAPPLPEAQDQVADVGPDSGWVADQPAFWPDGTPYELVGAGHRAGAVPATSLSGPDRWRSQCSCGWLSAGRFSTEDAASRMALAHKLGRLDRIAP